MTKHQRQKILNFSRLYGVNITQLMRLIESVRYEDMQTEIKTNNVVSFAAACYDTNTIDELKSALQSPADETDCQQWGLTEDEWKNAVKLALKWMEHGE